MIPYGRQLIDEEDVRAVVEVLQSDWLTQGPTIERFERAMAARCGARYAVTFNSATSALHAACLALELGPEDRLWTTPNTFVASANCGRYCSAAVDFVDIDPLTLNLSPTNLATKLEAAARVGSLPKILVPVHFAGQPCATAEIAELAQRYGVRVIEDASHAVGAEYAGKAVGSCTHSDITIFSFHPVKIMTTGEGGMALTNDAETYSRLLSLRSHGIIRDVTQMRGANEGGWYYQQLELGYNYRMTDIQAALGLSQLKRLDVFLERRRELVARYRQLLADLPVVLPSEGEGCRSAWHLYVIQCSQRAAVYEHMRAAGIGVNVHYIPVHLQPYYRDLGFAPGDFPVAEAYYSRALTLPLYAGMTDDQQDAVVAALRDALS